MASDTELTSENESKEGTPQADRDISATKEVVPKRRTKTGCLTCRKRRIKCGEERPVCKNCVKSKRECTGYSHPLVYKPHGQPQPQPQSQSIVNLPSSPTDHDWNHKQAIAFDDQLGHADAIPPSAQVVPTSFNNSVQWSAIPRPDTSSHIAPSTAFVGGPSFSSSDSDYDHRRASWSQPHISSFPNHAPSSLYQPVRTPVTTMAPDMARPDLMRPVLTHSRYSFDAGADATGTNHRRFNAYEGVQMSSVSNNTHLMADISHGRNGPISYEEDEDDPNDPWDVVEERMILTDDQPLFRSDLFSHRRASLPTFRSSIDVDSQVRAMIQNTDSTNSPLFEESSQRIFKHFISVTGPCMGTFDRREGFDSTGQPKLIWTHGLPAMAFKYPALAHAILAVSAMHMHNLSLGSESTAVKHFTSALRTVGIILNDPKQRLKVSTLATVLLLGYYEVMAGDHSRWNLHLSGAARLVMEHNYAGIIRNVRRLQAASHANIAQPWIQEQVLSDQELRKRAELGPQLVNDNSWKADQRMVSKLMGMEVNYDTQVQPNFQSDLDLPDLDQKSLDDSKLLMELYWWYCKQDVFMSMLSGDPLTLSYHQWKFCPPRGSFGNVDKPHATLDYLWLLIARLSNFGGKDRKRKQRVVNAQGGQWIPASGFLGPIGSSPAPNTGQATSHSASQTPTENQKIQPPSANEGRTRKARLPSGESPSQPNFYGMFPPANGPIHMPSSFDVMSAELRANHGSSPSDTDSPHPLDLEAQTRQALDEHTSIVEAFDYFESRLGADFQPLPSSDVQITTPFGAAIQYRSPIIATMWTYYYVGRILLRRMHPYSPPAAMVSAGVNARFTHEYAQLIGRICGGLFARHSFLLQAGHVDHNLSASVMETTFSLLFAAVQYHDPIQRGWTIGKLNEIAQVAGWKTATAVAGACETTWERAGMAGKGPPYQRTMYQDNSDMRVTGKHPSTNQQPSPSTNLSPTEVHESRFVSHDRNLIDRHASTRAYWALGLLSVEEDLQRMGVNDDE